MNAELLRHCWQALNKDAASGVDGLTATAYGENLTANLTDLAERVKAKRYRAKLVRRVYIPKENGQQRPLGIPALEDKLVQLACAKLLTALYEGDFLECSDGYRPGRSAKEAVCDLTFYLQYGSYGYLVEADIRGFFDHSDHDWLLEMLSLRIDHRAFVQLIRKWLKAGILETMDRCSTPAREPRRRDRLAGARKPLPASRAGPVVQSRGQPPVLGRGEIVPVCR